MLGTGTTGCAGWSDVYGGESYNLSGRNASSGPIAGFESIFTPKLHALMKQAGGEALPIGLHNAFQLLLAPDTKTVSWLTGIAYYGQPDPVSGYAILGSNLHFDLLQSRFSFGTFQPYGELGLAAHFGSHAFGNDGLVTTLGLQMMYIYNYLAPAGEPNSTSFATVKFGIGWDLH